MIQQLARDSVSQAEPTPRPAARQGGVLPKDPGNPVSDLKNGLKFLYRFNSSHRIQEPKTIILPYANHGDVLHIDLYNPPARSGPSQQLGSIVLLHGMSPLGRSDIRIKKLAATFAECGIRVLCPNIDSVSSLRIHTKQIDEVKDILTAMIEESSGLLGNGPCSVVAPSFTAGISMAALNRLPSSINNIMLIGTFVHLNNVLEYFFHNPDSDGYGKLLVLRNFYELTGMSMGYLEREGLRRAILDNYYRGQDKLVEKYLEDLNSVSPQARERVHSLLFDESKAQTCLENITKNIDMDNWNALEVLNNIDNIDSRVFLLHGKEDNVIPADQSSLLHRELQSRGKWSRLLITDLLSHGDSRLSLARTGEVFRLMKFFGQFISATKAA
jgi:pimeloyl-ACP methyl ester carboxylesterase